ncbi:MAG: O-antigen ligase family protein [Thermoguttaceae bacterium]
MGNIVVFCLCLLIGFEPFEMVGYLEGLPSVGRMLGVAVLVSAVLAVMAGHGLRRWCAVLILQLVFVAWSALSVAWALAPEQSLEVCIRMSLNFVLAFLIWEFAVTYGQQLWILRSFLIGLLVPMSLTFATFLGLYRLDVDPNSVRFTGAGNDQNYLAMILSMGIVLAAYFATASSSGLDRWLRPFYWTFAALAAVAAMLTGSRGGLVCLILATVFAAFLAGISLRRVIRSAAVLGFIVFVVVLIRYVVPQALQQRATRSTEEAASFGPRWAYWERGLTLTFPKNPLAGIGVGGFGAVTTELSGVKTGVAHNMPITALVELGVVGLLLYLVLCYSVFRATRGLPRREKLLWQGMLSIWFWASMLATLLTDKLFWLLPALLACQAAAMVRSRAGQGQPAGPGKGLPAIAPPPRFRWRKT